MLRMNKETSLPEFSKCIVISSSVAIQRSREREFIKGKDGRERQTKGEREKKKPNYRSKRETEFRERERYEQQETQ